MTSALPIFATSIGQDRRVMARSWAARSRAGMGASKTRGSLVAEALSATLARQREIFSLTLPNPADITNSFPIQRKDMFHMQIQF